MSLVQRLLEGIDGAPDEPKSAFLEAGRMASDLDKMRSMIAILLQTHGRQENLIKASQLVEQAHDEMWKAKTHFFSEGK